ncbi:MAG TPA: response regulator transcription factor [Bryobacteraceae bacterium]|nr:response regulator transcription factor [Bryobacteraceae bacterium]
MIRVLVADDHPLLRSALKQVISQEPDLTVAGEAEDSEQVLQKIEEKPYDFVILDLSMPGRGGLDVLREIRRLKPNLPVLVLSMYPEEQFAVRAIRAGANGYLSKDCAPAEVIRAIHRISTGKKYVSAGLAEMLANALDSKSDQMAHENLSNREFQVLCKIGAGRTVSQIAQEMALSVKTVSTYRTRVLEKMHMTTSAELVRYAITKGLVR